MATFDEIPCVMKGRSRTYTLAFETEFTFSYVILQNIYHVFIPGRFGQTSDCIIQVCLDSQQNATLT